MAMDERLHHLFGRMPEAKVHLYGKRERPGRKIGHVNVVGGGRSTTRYVAMCGSGPRGRHTGCRMREWTDGWDGHASEPSGLGSA